MNQYLWILVGIVYTVAWLHCAFTVKSLLNRQQQASAETYKLMAQGSAIIAAGAFVAAGVMGISI
jgi:fatty acid desaturase